MKILFYILIFSTAAFAQYGAPAKEAPHALGSASNHGLDGTNTHMWSIGESVVFTGTDNASWNFTQGFHQPMICKTFPIITSFNQTSCSLPYTLTTTSVFNVYRWKVGNRFIGEQKSNVYLPIKNGDYRVFVGDSTGCVLLSTPIAVNFSGKEIIPIITTQQNTISQDTLLKTTTFASYQWYVITPDGQHRAIVGATGQVFRPYFSASYYVKVNTIDQCIAYSASYTPINNSLESFTRYVFESTDSTINFSMFRKIYEPKLAVYPIPVLKDFTVDLESPNQNVVQMVVYNAEGKLVNMKSAKNNFGKLLVKFDRDDFPSGKYMLTVTDGDKQFVKGLIFE